MTLTDEPISRSVTETTYRAGPLARLGVWAATHRRLVTIAWVLIVVGLGAFAPSAEIVPRVSFSHGA
jgi:RND superfamily putative drug exporter